MRGRTGKESGARRRRERLEKNEERNERRDKRGWSGIDAVGEAEVGGGLREAGGEAAARRGLLRSATALLRGVVAAKPGTLVLVSSSLRGGSSRAAAMGSGPRGRARCWPPAAGGRWEPQAGVRSSGAVQPAAAAQRRQFSV